MMIHRQIGGLCAAAAILLALAPTALAAPAGDEYLPKVPKASGNPASHAQQPGTSAAASSSASDTTTSTQPQSGSAVSSGGNSSNGGGHGKQAKKKQPTPAPAPVSRIPASSSDDSSGSTLASPIIILLIAGVILAAVGMTLRRRNADGETPREETGAARPGAGKTPPTPDGEIVTGGDRAR